jgi:hypothetical protein
MLYGHQFLSEVFMLDLIKASDLADDFDRVAVDFINSMYSQGKFVWASSHILQKRGCALNEDFCAFPDEDSPEEDMRFIGVMVGVGEETSIIDEDAFFRIIVVACNKYADLHTDDARSILDLLENKGKR